MIYRENRCLECLKHGMCESEKSAERKGLFVTACSARKTKPKPMTNADRIRVMTDEELAFYIFNHPMWTDEKTLLEWLKSGVDNG